MIYALILDRSEAGHVEPVVDALRSMGHDVVEVRNDIVPPQIGRDDTALCVGDRLDTLRFLVLHCPTARICQLHAGEITGPALDDSRYRWAISGMATALLCATREAAYNANDCGRARWSGAPCLQHAAERAQEARERPPLNGRPYVLFAMNAWVGGSEKDVERTLADACSEASTRGWWVYVVQPNAEAAWRLEQKWANAYMQSLYSLPHDEFQRVIAGAKIMVGNSSAGIIEAPSLGTPTINVGPRQDGRERASSIVDIGVGGCMGDAFGSALSASFEMQPYNERKDPAERAAQMVAEVAKC